jgi:DNA-binding transcriptional MerR regulator
VSSHRPLPDKLYFKIGEVADLVGVKPHVLRYWETEFAALRPKKTRGAHRHYSRRDVELAMLLRRLLHDEGYTVPGAKKRLRELGHHRRDSPPEPNAAREVALRAELLAVREQLAGLLELLDGDRVEVVTAEAAQVTVHQVLQHRAPRRDP